MIKNIFLNKCCFSKSSIYFFVIIAVSFTSCHPLDPENELVKEWYVTNYRTPLAKSGGDGPVSIIRFYKSGKYSQFGPANTYAFGIWRYYKADTLLSLHPTSGTEILDAFYHIDKLNRRSMQITLYRNLPVKPGSAELTLALNAGPKMTTEDDPYKPELHNWRKKPTHPETDKQISKRVKMYLMFLKTLYRHAIDNKFEILTTNWYPHPLRMHYGNGVRMAYSNELYGWYDCFYDSAQAVKGYQVISGPIQNVTLKSGISKPKRNLDCVEQLLKKIEL